VRILIAGAFHDAWQEEAWARALRELGHEVSELRLAPRPGSLSERVQNRLVTGPMIARLNRALLEFAEERAPEVIVCYRALLVTPATVAELRKRARMVCYQNDNVFGPLAGKAYWRLFKAAIPEYQLHLVYRDDDLARYQRSGARSVYLLRSHYLPWLHRPLPREALSGWECDLGFFGHCEPDDRLEQLDALMRAVPARYGLRGSSWQKYARGRAWQGLETQEVSGEEYARALCGARIALGFLSTLNADRYTRRVFEIPACGSLLLAPRTDVLRALYREDREAVFYGSTAELIERARHLLAHEGERAAIAGAGHARALQSGYDVHSRMREWLSALDKL